MKRCTTCRQILDVSSFDKSTRTSDGLMVRCRECNNAYKNNERSRYAEDSKYRQAKAKYHKERSEDPAFLEKRAEHERKRYAEDEQYKESKSEYHRQRAEDPSYLDQRASHERERYSNDQEYKKLKAEYRMEKYRNDPKMRVDNNISSQIRQSLNQGKEGQSWEVLVGYTLD